MKYKINNTSVGLNKFTKLVVSFSFRKPLKYFVYGSKFLVFCWIFRPSVWWRQSTCYNRLDILNRCLSRFLCPMVFVSAIFRLITYCTREITPPSTNCPRNHTRNGTCWIMACSRQSNKLLEENRLWIMIMKIFLWKWQIPVVLLLLSWNIAICRSWYFRIKHAFIQINL